LTNNSGDAVHAAYTATELFIKLSSFISRTMEPLVLFRAGVIGSIIDTISGCSVWFMLKA